MKTNGNTARIPVVAFLYHGCILEINNWMDEVGIESTAVWDTVPTTPDRFVG